MTTGKTRYINSDLVLASKTAIDRLCDAFDHKCCVLYQQQDDDGNWHASIESDRIENISAADDIQKMLEVIPQLGDDAREQWDNCFGREINIGFECGDTWAYPHSLPNSIVREIADAECTLAITLYPIRDEAEH